MSNLIPTPRTDKNGRTVIRHMKPQTAGTDKPTVNLPMPAAVPDHHKTLVHETALNLFSIIEENYGGRNTALIINAIENALAKYSVATLDRIQHNEWLPHAANTLALGITTRWDETQANDFIAACHALREHEPHGVPAIHNNAWKHYRELHPANNDGDYPKERLDQIVTLYFVTEYMIADGEEPYYWDTYHLGELANDIEFIYLGDDNQLRKLILHPGPDYKCEDILRIVTAHHTYDPEKIKRMLDLGVPSMTSGVL